MNTEKTVTFLLKSKEFENYEQEFKKLINIGNEFQYLEKKYIEEFEKYQKIIENLENKKLSIVKLYCKATLKNNLQKSKTLEREKIVVDGKIKNFNVRLQITKDFIKKLSLMTEQEQFLMQSRIVKENENKFHLLIIDKYLKSNQLGLNSSMMMTTKDYKFTMNSNSKKIIDGDSYKLWIQEIIQFCKKNQDKLKNQNLVLLSDVIKSSWTDMIRKNLILEDKKYKIWESINLTENSDEGIGESIKSQNLENQSSTSGYKPNSPQM